MKGWPDYVDVLKSAESLLYQTALPDSELLKAQLMNATTGPGGKTVIDHSSDMRLPLAAEEIDAAWLSEALRFRHPDAEVKAVHVVDVMHGTSTKIRVAPDYARDTGLPPTMVVKGGFEPHSEWMAGMYQTEVRFYREVRPYIDMNTPRCFYAGSDPDSYQSIVILEDLVARNVTFLNPLRPVNFAQMARRLEDMAKYHAQSWASPEFEPGGRFENVCSRYDGFGRTFHETYLRPENWERLLAMPRGAAVPRIFHDRDWMAGALAYLEDYHRKFPVCLAHGDTHLGNLYIEQDGTPGFLDAQCNREPWFFEVNYHLVVGLDMLDRKAWEKPLLERYLAALLRYGVDAPGFDAAWEAYRRETAYGFFIFAINENAFQTESVNTAQAARFASAAIDHDTVRLLSQ